MTIRLLSTAPRVRPVLDRPVTRIPLYKVLLHNDDVNTMEHVVGALITVFKFERAICERIMIEAHANRLALCTVEPLEPAELHRDQLRSYSLMVTLEPE
jgi:ATP-dependent Clp protease adaptor protein ClpS